MTYPGDGHEVGTDAVRLLTLVMVMVGTDAVRLLTLVMVTVGMQ